MDNNILYTAKFTHLKFHKVWWKSDKRFGSWSGQTDRQTDGQTDRWTDRQMDGWTNERVLVRMKTFDRQTDRQTDRWTDGLVRGYLWGWKLLECKFVQNDFTGSIFLGHAVGTLRPNQTNRQTDRPIPVYPSELCLQGV
jgi:hypothetical protein